MTLSDPSAALLSALRTRLLTAPLLPARRAWENIAFLPSADNTPYIEDSWLGGPAVSRELGQHREGRYLYQIMVYGPPDVGAHDMLRVADSISGTLQASAIPVTGNADPAYVVSVRIGPRMVSPPGWYALPVSVTLSMYF